MLAKSEIESKSTSVPGTQQQRAWHPGEGAWHRGGTKKGIAGWGNAF